VLNNWHKNRVKTLEKELENSKTYFENLEMHCKNSSCLCNSKTCENCKTLESKVHYLVRIVDKLSKGKSNFETVLASQKCIFGKSSLGFNPQSKKNGISKPFLKVPKKQPIENRNNRLLHVFIALREVTQLDYVKLGNILFLKASLDGFPKILKFPMINVNQKEPHL